ncbi:MAG: glucose-1-phosphate adenylyltransferase, partial [Acidobacteriia bacterium]|nr:glucose-1-phosphate adenylyltransferase [Terriglobia bacterium]
AKPAVPFGGSYRVIDFTLSNCVNSNIRRIFVLTQYKSLELTRHIRDGWNIFSPELGEFVEVIPPMKRIHEGWYLGTADAVYQNIESIEAEHPDYTLIVSGDHIYKMNYRRMLDWHRHHRAEVTIATIQTKPENAHHYGVAEIGPGNRIVGFQEKPPPGEEKRSLFDDEMVSASMGEYGFNTELLLEALREDALQPDSSHDFAKDVLPGLLPRARVLAYDFHDMNDKTVRYWRDVGTLDAYYEANMDLVSVTPEFNLYDKNWPVRTFLPQQPPAKFVFAQEGRRMGLAVDSIVSSGCIVSGGRVMRCVLSSGVRVNSYCEILDSILLTGVRIGRHSRIRRAIVDVGVEIPDGSVIGYDRDEDVANGHHVTESGVVVVSSGGAASRGEWADQDEVAIGSFSMRSASPGSAL